VTSIFVKSDPCDFFLWDTLKDKICSNNPHTEDELKDSIQAAVSYISLGNLGRLRNNVFIRRDTYLLASGNYFQHL
jgi:hypothetical protein